MPLRKYLPFLLTLLMVGAFCGEGIAQSVWKGGTSSDWATPGNWSAGGVPTATSTVTFNAAVTNYPVVSASTNAVAASITFSGTVTSQSLQVDGTLTVSGTIALTQAASGSANLNVAVSGTGTLTAGTLSISNSGGKASKTSNVSVTSSVTNLELTTLTLPTNTTNQSSTFTLSGGTLTVGAVSSTGTSTATFSFSSGTAVNFTANTPFSGLASGATNAVSMPSTVGFTGATQAIYPASTVIANTTPSATFGYTNLKIGGSGIKTPSAALTVTGNFTNSLANDATDSVNFSTNGITFSGSSAQSLNGGSGNGTMLYTANFSGGGTKTLSGTFTVAPTGEFSITDASTTVAAGSGLLTLRSNSTGSAAIGIITSPSQITGTVNVQRYVTGGSTSYRGYRTMTSPVSSTGTTGGLIDLSYIPATTYVTGATCTGCTPTGNSSLFLYDEALPVNNSSFVSGNFVGVAAISGTTISTLSGSTTTTNQSLPVANGFFMYYRGDKIHNTANKTVAPYAAADNVIFTSTGTLNQGTIVVKDWFTPSSSALSYSNASAVAKGFNLVGNPYACSINWDLFNTTSIPETNISSTIYVYNPVARTYGTYVAGSGGIGTNFLGTNTTANILASGQGFFVQATGASPALSFTENAKVPTQQATSLMLSSAPLVAQPQYMRLKLYLDSINYEEGLIFLKNTASKAYVQNEDGKYLKGSSSLNFSTMSSDKVALAVNAIPYPASSQVIPLNVNITASGTYQIQMPDVVNIPALFDVWLKDANQKDSLDIKHNPAYSFKANAADTTTFKNRFTLVIRPNPAYAYRLLNFTAEKVINTAKLSWITENEDNYTVFNLQRSTDGGKTFTTISTVNSSGAGNYSYIDSQPGQGENDYRLQQIDLNGAITYSVVIQLTFPGASAGKGAAANNLNIYPNPATSTINLTILSASNVGWGYTITIATSDGYVVKTLSSPQATWQGNVSDLRPGTYVVRVISKADNTVVGVNKFIKL